MKCKNPGCHRTAQKNRGNGLCRRCDEIRQAGANELMAELERRGCDGDGDGDAEPESESSFIDLGGASTDGYTETTVCVIPENRHGEEQITTVYILHQIIGALSDDDSRPRLKALAKLLANEL